MSRLAILEYVTTASGTSIFLIKEGLPAPLVFEARGDGGPVTRGMLEDCARRLLADFHGLPPGWDDRLEVGDFRRSLGLPPATRAPKRGSPVTEDKLVNPRHDYRMTYWQGLSGALLPADLRPHLEDCELLCLIPHGPLHALPMAALPWDEGRVLIQRFGICHAPSLAVLRHCRGRNRARGEGDGDGGGAGRPRRLLVAAVAAAEDEDPRDFEGEGDGLAAVHGGSGEVTRLVGPGESGATKGAIGRAVAGQDVVHLACHGVFGLDRGRADALDSGLLVSDGASRPPLTCPPEERARLAPFLLSAREVFGLDLSADLVVLRACSSGRAYVGRGDDPLGLARAFFYAGTPSLIVGLWDVSKRTSRRLLETFYRLWLGGAGLPKWRALQRAQMAFLDDPEHEFERHPYHWAPFILVGDWA